MSNDLDKLVPFAIGLLGRIAFPPETLEKIVMQGSGEKQKEAYNLCDGTRKQADIAKEVGLDASNFRKTVKRWEREGVLVRIGDDGSPRLLGLYRL